MVDVEGPLSDCQPPCAAEENAHVPPSIEKTSVSPSPSKSPKRRSVGAFEEAPTRVKLWPLNARYQLGSVGSLATQSVMKMSARFKASLSKLPVAKFVIGTAAGV